MYQFNRNKIRNKNICFFTLQRLKKDMRKIYHN